MFHELQWVPYVNFEISTEFSRALSFRRRNHEDGWIFFFRIFFIIKVHNYISQNSHREHQKQFLKSRKLNSKNIFAPQAHFPGCAQPSLLECPVSVTFPCVSGDFIREARAYDLAENETTPCIRWLLVRQEKHHAMSDILFWVAENWVRRCGHTPIWVPPRVSAERWREDGEREGVPKIMKKSPKKSPKHRFFF